MLPQLYPVDHQHFRGESEKETRAPSKERFVKKKNDPAQREDSLRRFMPDPI